MPYYYPEDTSEENLKKIRRNNVCAECGRQLSVYLDMKTKQIYIACSGQIHEGITREYTAPVNDYQSNIRRETELEQKVGTQGTKALANIPRTGQLTQQQAEAIITTVWKDAPPLEVFKAKVLCADYGLHPLMKHIFLIKYDRYKKKADGSKEKVGEDWSIQIGIGATRLMAHRKHNFSYIDDTPRRMTKTEGEKILGEDYRPDRGVYGITRIKDMTTGAEAMGWAVYGNSEPEPKGIEKGNSRPNMAHKRSEAHAIDRQYPGEMPSGYDIIDEQFMDTPSGKVEIGSGEIVEGEVVELQPSPERIESTTSHTKEETSATHWCEVHQCEFEQKTGKYGTFYAHKKDGGGWCNESKKKEAKKEAAAPAPAVDIEPEPPLLKRDPDSIKSISELFKACAEDFILTSKEGKPKGMQPYQVIAELGVSSQSAISETPAECYRKIASVR